MILRRVIEMVRSATRIWEDSYLMAACSMMNADAIRDGKGPHICVCGHHTMKQRVETWKRMGAPLKDQP